MKFTINDIRKGNCVVLNNGTPNELAKVLKLAFPNDIPFDTWEHWQYKYFGKSDVYPNEWQYSDELDSFDLPFQSVKEFLINDNIIPIQPEKPVLNEVNRSIDDLIKLIKYQLNQIDMDFEIKIIPKIK
jgi:hypothetical protein